MIMLVATRYDWVTTVGMPCERSKPRRRFHAPPKTQGYPRIIPEGKEMQQGIGRDWVEAFLKGFNKKMIPKM